MTNLQLKEILGKLDQSELLGGHTDAHIDGHADSGVDLETVPPVMLGIMGGNFRRKNVYNT